MSMSPPGLYVEDEIALERERGSDASPPNPSATVTGRQRPFRQLAPITVS
jgi:hypothetical protein